MSTLKNIERDRELKSSIKRKSPIRAKPSAPHKTAEDDCASPPRNTELPSAMLLQLRDVGGDAPASIRMRRALKCLLRSFGWRCTSIHEATATSPAQAGDGQAGPATQPEVTNAR